MDEAPPGSVDRCAYCGAAVDRRLSYCYRCGEDFGVDPEILLEPAPHRPTLEARLRQEAEPAWNLFLVLATLVIVAGTVAPALAGPGFVTLLVQDLIFAGATTVFVVLHWTELRHLFRAPRPSALALLSLPILGGCLALNRGYHGWLEEHFHQLSDEGLAGLFGELEPWQVFLAICLFPGVFEELGFRGLAQERFVRVLGLWPGFLLTSLLFTALHFSALSAPYLFLLSLFFCWVRQSSGSLYLPMLLHFLHNLGVWLLYRIEAG